MVSLEVFTPEEVLRFMFQERDARGKNRICPKSVTIHRNVLAPNPSLTADPLRITEHLIFWQWFKRRTYAG